MPKSAKVLAAAVLAVLPAVALAQSAQHVMLTIDDGKAKAQSSPTLYGLMTEEINYSYDGGLYGELLRNRAVAPSWSGADHWTLVQRGTASAKFSLDPTTGPSAALHNSMKIEVATAGADAAAGVENEGYWGIPLRPQTTYQASFWGKSSAPNTTVTLALVNDDSGKILASQQISGVGADWKQYKATLRVADITPSDHNHFLILVANPCTLWVNLASLFGPTYHDRTNGNRIDLMEKLAAMHPAFLRFPGGNYLEGDHINERFEWKKTIGPLVDRPTHPSPWGYQSSDGMGLLEFLEWCEDLHMQPVLAVYAGYSLKGDHVEPGPALEPYVQDALDEIQYVTGATSTKWGAERARDGHPAPFKLHYVEIGNEDFFDKSKSYSGRYAQFYDAIKKQHPGLELIATTPVQGHAYDLVDDHFYESASTFYNDVHHYDNTPRTGPKIFVGEWATREGTPTPNFGAALGDAAWMTGMERNSDVVVLASYAPLLTNVNPGGLQWDTDLIGYNAMSSYGSPSYYAQVLFAQHRGNQILATDSTGDAVRVFHSVTRDSASGTIYLKLVNASTLPSDVEVHLDHATGIEPTGTEYTLTAPTTETTNSITDPTRVMPMQQPVSTLADQFTAKLAPLSINVYEIRTKH